MRAGEREPTQVVIEFRVQPVRGRMTGETIRRKFPQFVIRILRGFELLHMAAVAVVRGTRKPAGNMAKVTAQRYVRTHQGKLRHRVVIEFRVRPCAQAVADLAVVHESRLGMIGIPGRGEVVRMAAEAVRRCAEIPVPNMAIDAVQLRVRADERETGKSCMVEAGTVPGIHFVTLIALRRQLRCDMIRIFCAAVVLQVA